MTKDRRRQYLERERKLAYKRGVENGERRAERRLAPVQMELPAVALHSFDELRAVLDNRNGVIRNPTTQAIIRGHLLDTDERARKIAEEQ